VSDFKPAPARIVGERDEREALAARALPYFHPYLDDALRAILPHDLVLLGAPTGAGKTDLAMSIAASNARKGRGVYCYALEAEPREIERRIKYGLLVEASIRASHPHASDLNFPDWMLGRCEHVCRDFNAAADATIADQLRGLHTFYRGAKFDQSDLRKSILEVHADADLIVIDHLHYVDNDDESENRALSETVKTIRDLSLRIGKPIILVAHLRKRDPRAKQLVATLDDFHGSSNISKISTQAITIERAHNVEPPKWYLAPTFISILKDRRGGSPGFVALSMFDRRYRSYQASYTLGRTTDGGTAWEPLRLADVPRWAKGHREPTS